MWTGFSGEAVNVSIENDCIIFRRVEIPARVFREDEKPPIRREEIETHFRREEIKMIFREAVCHGT